MTLRDLLTSLRKQLVVVVATTVLVTVAVGLASSLSQPVYRSSVSLYFTLDIGGSASDFNQGSAYTQNQLLSFAQLAKLPVVLDAVVEDLDLDVSAQTLAHSVSATRPQDTSILEIQATSGSPERAAEIAGAVAERLTEVVRQIAPRDETGRSTVDVLVAKEAQVPQYPIAPNTRRNVLAGFVIGLIGGALIAYLRDALDTRVRRPEDVQAVADIPVLASISRSKGRARKSLPIDPRPMGTQAEEYRRLRTSLQFLSVDSDGLCLVFSSAIAGEGKTTTCLNLAVALAEADMKVLVIDADMRSPRVGASLGIESSAGLTTVLIGRADVDDVVQPWGAHGMSVLTAGVVPPNPSELVATRALRDLVANVRKEYDIVLIDAPPLLPVADAAVLSVLASGVILVGDTRRLRRPQLREAVDVVSVAGGHVLGVVLNQVKPRTSKDYHYAHELSRRTR